MSSSQRPAPHCTCSKLGTKRAGVSRVRFDQQSIIQHTACTGRIATKSWLGLSLVHLLLTSQHLDMHPGAGPTASTLSGDALSSSTAGPRCTGTAASCLRTTRTTCSRLPLSWEAGRGRESGSWDNTLSAGVIGAIAVDLETASSHDQTSERLLPRQATGWCGSRHARRARHARHARGRGRARVQMRDFRLCRGSAAWRTQPRMSLIARRAAASAPTTDSKQDPSALFIAALSRQAGKCSSSSQVRHCCALKITSHQVPKSPTRLVA